MKNQLLILFVSICCLPLFQCKQAPETTSKQTSQVEFSPDRMRDIPGLTAKRGLILKTDESTPGYILFHPTFGTSTYLMNLDGQIVHEWKDDLTSMLSYIMDDGSVIRHDRVLDDKTFAAGGQSGVIRRITWDNEIIWDFKYATPDLLTHHDLAIMPNGNVLANAWEVKTKEECIALGLDPEKLPDAGLWFDKVIEIEPQGRDGGKIVWEWRMWDHLIQDIDASKPNYGIISEHPGKLNLNPYLFKANLPVEAIAELVAQGVATSNLTPAKMGSDVTHLNAIDYNAELDQIALSSYWFSEVFIIDHSATIEETSGTSGDLLYRWGNPQNYGRGGPEDELLKHQHDVRWIPEGYPGAGHLMIFNNDIYGGNGKYPGVFEAIPELKRPMMTLAELDNYTAVLELELPINDDGNYSLPDEDRFGPVDPVWSYTAPDKYSFYAPFISGAHRIKNGNTFINSGPRGRLFEVTPKGKIVWEYWNQYFEDYRMPDGTVPQPAAFFFFSQYRAMHIPPDHPALVDRELRPISPQPEVFIPKPPPGAEGEGH